MLTRVMAEKMVNLSSGQTEAAPFLNEDLIGHEAEIAGIGHAPFYMRLLPRRLRVWIETRQTENALIAMWQTNPHLLDDIGVVLSRSQVLPTHLIPAPARLLEEVAATSPQTIVAAELAFPPLPSETGAAPEAAREITEAQRGARKSMQVAE